nr:palmitoyl-acyl carrier protein thioesterase, chloroplastic-like [Tanacetum cinerariifolium]
MVLLEKFKDANVAINLFFNSLHLRFFTCPKMTFSHISSSEIIVVTVSKDDQISVSLGAVFIDKTHVIDNDNMKLPKLDENTTDHVRTGLTVSKASISMN